MDEIKYEKLKKELLSTIDTGCSRFLLISAFSGGKKGRFLRSYNVELYSTGKIVEIINKLIADETLAETKDGFLIVS